LGQASSTLLVSAALSPTSDVHLVSAFKHTYYRLIIPGVQPPKSNPHNVFVCADHAPAAAVAIALINSLSDFQGLYAGNLQYSKIVELLSPLWLAQLERDNFDSFFYAGWRFGT
jgi:predicted dinucleotide-binding enzyme